MNLAQIPIILGQIRILIVPRPILNWFNQTEILILHIPDLNSNAT